MAKRLKTAGLATLGTLLALALCLATGAITVDSAEAVQFGSIAPAAVAPAGFGSPDNFGNMSNYASDGNAACAASCKGTCADGICRPRPTLRRKPCPKSKHRGAEKPSA